MTGSVSTLVIQLLLRKEKKKQSLVIQSVLCYEEILDMFIFDPP